MSNLVPGRPRRQSYRRSNTSVNLSSAAAAAASDPDPYVGCTSSVLDKFGVGSSSSGSSRDATNSSSLLNGGGGGGSSKWSSSAALKDFLLGRSKDPGGGSGGGTTATAGGSSDSPSSFLNEYAIEDLKKSYWPRQPKYSYLLNKPGTGRTDYAWLPTVPNSSSSISNHQSSGNNHNNNTNNNNSSSSNLAYGLPTSSNAVSTASGKPYDDILDSSASSNNNSGSGGGANSNNNSHAYRQDIVSKYIGGPKKLPLASNYDHHSSLSGGPSSNYSVKKSKSYSNFGAGGRRDPILQVRRKDCWIVHIVLEKSPLFQCTVEFFGGMIFLAPTHTFSEGYKSNREKKALINRSFSYAGWFEQLVFSPGFLYSTYLPSQTTLSKF